MKQSIFVVEDDTALQELYWYSLKNEFDCLCYSDSDSFFAALADQLPHLVILDLMLPGEDGYSILSRLKKDRRTSLIPVIIISAKGEELSKVKGLDMGADDYMEKPFGILELVARIKAHLRNSAQNATDCITHRDVVIDHNRHQITARDKQITVTLKEYNLLCLLCENAEKVLNREFIFSEVWGDNFVGETRTLDIHINELRKKLSEAQSDATIQTIRGIGYVLT
jgi:two-component system alkaline phosphatase synthesis response regulator PhoP